MIFWREKLVDLQESTAGRRTIAHSANQKQEGSFLPSNTDGIDQSWITQPLAWSQHHSMLAHKWQTIQHWAWLFPLTNIPIQERALLWWLPDVTDERVQAGQRVAGYLMTGVSVIFICMHAACASSVGASHQGTLIRLNICEINQ